MELRRTAIIVALAVVSYMLFLAWQQDYGMLAKPEPVTTTATAPAKTADIPVLASAPAANSGSADIPVLPQSATPQVLASQPGAVAHQSIIHVQTDIFDINIDTAGGNIVNLSLPKYTTTAASQEPFPLLEKNAGRSYVAESHLVGESGFDINVDHTPYQSAASSYSMVAGQNDLEVVLSLPSKDGVVVQKVFHFKRGSYLLNISYRVLNQGNKAQVVGMVGQLIRDGSKDPSASQGRFGMSTFLGGAWWSPEKRFNKLAFNKFADTPLSERTQGGWAAIVQHYFLCAWIPDKNTINQFSTVVSADKNSYAIKFVGTALQVDPGHTGSVGADFYAGPKMQEILKTISPGLDLTVDYGWLWFIAKILFWLLTHIYTVVGNWGWSIVLLTIFVKALFFPLSARSYKSMANMRRVMPEMARLKEVHANDRAKLGQATMDLYRKEGVNPLGGCLPILVQMPVFIALYWTLMESVELRHATWMWINDLSIMDPWFALPITMGVTMLVQQTLNPPPTDPTQAKVMKIMPVMFTFMFLWFPAGLVLYWVVNNMLSITQQWVITRSIEKAAAAK
jgi:YidC/Oxa1 family membrane protein insertase